MIEEITSDVPYKLFIKIPISDEMVNPDSTYVEQWSEINVYGDINKIGKPIATK